MGPSGHFYLSRSGSQSDPIGGSEPGLGCETIYWDSLLTFLDIGVPILITESKYYIQVSK